jgi:hypothetical protein
VGLGADAGPLGRVGAGARDLLARRIE